jgi:hypothetical protein
MATAAKRGGRITAPKPVEDEDNFDSARYRGKGGYEFTLGGRKWHCRSDVPFSLMQLERAAVEGEEDRAFHVQFGIFMQGVLEEDQADAFMEMISSPRSPLHSGNMMPLVRRITEKLTARNFEQPGSSAGGARRTASRTGTSPAKSGASSSSRATARQRSAS